MSYTKDDAKMTQGLAIICMVVLHLFCRQGADVLGAPVFWINETTPVVYWFGFFAEICVPLYTLCIGYAQELLFEQKKSSFMSRAKRIAKLMLNYWVVLVLFSILGLIVDPDGAIPGSFLDFIQAIVLLKSYNGAWWFLHTYIFLLLLPPKVILFPVRKLPAWMCISLCACLYGGMYIVERFDLPSLIPCVPVLDYAVTEAVNLFGILAYVWIGALFCKSHFMEQLAMQWNRFIPRKIQKLALFVSAIVLFVGSVVIHKALLMGPIAILVFLMFNLWQKSKVTRTIMLFLGDHSTNIWLVHMFFYACFFVGLVEYARWPLLMLLFMFALCIVTSYMIKVCLWSINSIVFWVKKKFSKKRTV